MHWHFKKKELLTIREHLDSPPIYWGCVLLLLVFCVVLCFLFVLFVGILCLVSCLVLPVSLGNPFVIVPSVFSNVYFNEIRSVVNCKVNQVIILIKLLLTLNVLFNIPCEEIMFNIGQTTVVHFLWTFKALVFTL